MWRERVVRSVGSLINWAGQGKAGDEGPRQREAGLKPQGLRMARAVCVLVSDEQREGFGRTERERQASSEVN